MLKSILLIFLFGLTFVHLKAQNEGFIQNKGQFPNQVIAAVSLENGFLFVEKDGLVFSLFDQRKTEEEHLSKKVVGGLPRFALKQQFIGTSPQPSIEFESPLPHYFNYFTPKAVPRVSIFKKLWIKNFYPGIDWEIFIENKQVKHNFYVSHPKKAKQIQWEYLGLKKVHLDQSGIWSDLGFTEFRESSPVSFQNEKVIKSRFEQKNGKFCFHIQNLISQSPIVIDPILQFSTFTGGLSDNWGFTATYDKWGNAYAGGIARGAFYPVSFGAIDTSYNGSGSNHDIVITKFDSSGSQLLYSTFLGGVQDDEPMSLITDSLGQLYILGHSLSADFPVDSNGFDTTHNGNWDIVVSKFNDSGTVLLGSTFLGGFEDDAFNNSSNTIWNSSNFLNYNYGDYCRGEVNLDQHGNIYIVSNTKSSNFPVVSPAIQDTLRGLQDAVISSFSSDLRRLRFSTYWGGNDYDAAYSIHVSDQNRVYVGGGTMSRNLNAFPGGFQANFVDTVDGFVFEIDTLGTQILHGTFVGTPNYDQVFLIQTDLLGNVFVAGQTEGIFPISQGKYGNAGGKVFAQRFSSNLSQRTLSTTFGSGNHAGPDFSPTAFLVDVCGRIYLAGWGGNLNNLLGTNPSQGNTRGLPTTTDALKDSTNGNDYYLIVLEKDADSLLYGSFLGGNISGEHVDGGTSRFDPQGVVYHAACAGCGGFSDFPTTPNAYSRTNNSTNCNMAIFKLDFQFVRIQANFTIQSSQNLQACQGVKVQFQCLSGSPDSLYWDFDDGTTSTLLNPQHTFSIPRKYNVKLFVKNCFNTDTIVKEVTIFPPPQIRISGPPKMCQGQSVQLIASGGTTYSWNSDSTLSDTSIFNPIARPPFTKKYFVLGTDSNGCKSKDSIQIIVFNSLNPIIETDTSICAGDSIRFWANQDTSLISTWIWESKRVGFLDSNAYPFYSPNSTDTVYFRYTTKDGCTLVDSVIVKIFFSVIANAGPDIVGCSGSTITITASGGSGFVWSTGQKTSAISVAVKDSIQWYSVVVNQGKCKSKPDSVAVYRSSIFAQFDVNIDTGYAPQEVKFFNKSSSNAVGFDWDFDDGTLLKNVVNPSHIYQKEGIYIPKLLVESANPVCRDTFEYRFIFIDSVKLVIPNAFSPNNDGINENLIFEGFNLSVIEVHVFDRWGQEIFKGEGEKVSWDGKLNGKICTVGVYPYLVNAVGKNGKTYRWQGLVTLVR